MKYNTFFILSLLFISLEISNAIKVEAGNYTCIEKERDALLNFKSYIQHDPYGLLSNWTRDDEANHDCCQWFGVKCDNQTGHVTSLDLFNGSLEGKISPSLLNLSYLNYLDLSRNSFSGTIPKFIGSLAQLTALGLGWNDFSGTIPSELGNLTNLQSLYLRDLNNCTVENLDWLCRLSQLEHLSMDGISLAKADNWVNVILSLKKLSFLSLEECDLSLVMHPYSHSSVSVNSSFSSSIVRLYLYGNNLNSSMYHWLFPLTSNKLEYLDLSGNKLDGIPIYLGNLCSLRGLSLSYNSIAIRFSDFLNILSGCTSVSLQQLYATGNQLTGPLSDDIQKFQSLLSLDLSSNQLKGATSEKIWQLPQLQYLNISFNSLSGTISKNVGKSNISGAEMSNLSNLITIDLRSNNLYGELPNNLSSVQFLDLSKNQFYGGISFLCQIANDTLSFLDLSDNLLSGNFPYCLWHFKYLKVLNLGQNNLSGRLPLSFQECTRLTFLELGANKFSGHVPVWIGEKLKSLYALSLTSNSFFGTIPSKLCHLVNLQILDLSMNKLHGTIPSCLNNISAMVKGGLSSNQNFHSLDGLRKGEYVDHAMIKWQGSTREFSRTLGLVISINLSQNNLTGKIPNELTDLKELVSLNLSTNALHGEIPSKIGLMKNLLHFDISRNNISGLMPPSMSQMTSLEYLDVSRNNLCGRIPSSTQLQSFEPSKYIGNAKLCGLPLTKFCPGDKELKVPPVTDESEDDVQEKDELERCFYIGGATGFAIGFWAICSGLLLYHRGRCTFFEFMNNLEDWVYVKVMVFIASLV